MVFMKVSRIGHLSKALPNLNIRIIEVNEIVSEWSHAFYDRSNNSAAFCALQIILESCFARLIWQKNFVFGNQRVRISTDSDIVESHLAQTKTMPSFRDFKNATR